MNPAKHLAICAEIQQQYESRIKVLLDRIAKLQTQRQPLTDEQNAKRWRWALCESPEWTYAVCKWDGEDWLPIKTEHDIKELDATIEAAHGIKGEA